MMAIHRQSGAGMIRTLLKRRLPSTSAHPVLAAAVSLWALLLGMLMLMLGNGLQGTLIGVRASGEGFTSNSIGLVMSGYFIGFLAGSVIVPKLITGVGHLRVFAALAALSSVSILVHSVLIVPWIWVLMRLVTGFAFAGIYVVAESWLNDRVTNEHRGGLLSIYMIISYLGLTGGQLLLNLADPGLHDLFIVIAILVSLASVPILLVITQTPVVQDWSALSPLQLLRQSHLGAIGTTVSGVAGGVVLGMGPVYAASVGMSVAEISLFMAALVGAGALTQWPIGRFSDRFDRRRVLVLASVTGAVAALVAAVLTILLAERAATAVIGLGMVIGAAVLALYPLLVAYTNDRIEPEQRVGAGSSLIMLYGSGAIVGPLITGPAMEALGPSGFFWLLFAILGGLGAYTYWRIRRGRPLKIEEQTHAPQLPGRTLSLIPAWIDTLTRSRRPRTHRNAAPAAAGTAVEESAKSTTEANDGRE